jgi:hypothetical protein
MSLIGNMKKEEEYLSTFIHFNNTSRMLRRLSKGQILSHDEKEEIAKMGDLFAEIDWESKPYKKTAHKELFTIANELRPLFYKTVLDQKIYFDSGYSERIYLTLKSPDNPSLSFEELSQVQEIFKSMSDTIILKIQPNSGKI